MRIGVLTGGGDCPGLNAVIRAVVRKGVSVYGHDFVGFRDGWRGPMEADAAPLGVEQARDVRAGGGARVGARRPPNGVGARIAIGGEDPLGVAKRLYDDGVNVVGVPKPTDID